MENKILKATDYFARFSEIKEENNDVKDLLLEVGIRVLQDLTFEIDLLCRQRKSYRQSTVLPIIKEIDDKWRKIQGLFNEKFKTVQFGRKSFLLAIKAQMPLIYDLYKAQYGEN